MTGPTRKPAPRIRKKTLAAKLPPFSLEGWKKLERRTGATKTVLLEFLGDRLNECDGDLEEVAKRWAETSEAAKEETARRRERSSGDKDDDDD
jgi:hypothetical protein